MTCDNKRLRKGDRPLIKMGDNDFTYNEAHSTAIGAALGLFLGERGLAIKTILSEPWYFAAAFAALYALARHLYR